MQVNFVALFFWAMLIGAFGLMWGKEAAAITMLAAAAVTFIGHWLTN